MTDRPQPQPMKPWPKTFALLCLIFAAWVATLLWMYFHTVYPRRHPAATQTMASLF